MIIPIRSGNNMIPMYISTSNNGQPHEATLAEYIVLGILIIILLICIGYIIYVINDIFGKD